LDEQESEVIDSFKAIPSEKLQLLTIHERRTVEKAAFNCTFDYCLQVRVFDELGKEISANRIASKDKFTGLQGANSPPLLRSKLEELINAPQIIRALQAD